MKISDITIRPATLEDAEGIAFVHVKGWQESYKNIIEQDYLDALSLKDKIALRQKILRGLTHDHLNLIAVCNDQIVGFCDAGPCFDGNKDYPGEIYALYLLDDIKKCGLGSKLFSLARSHLLKKSLTPFKVWGLEKNAIARRFYEKNGGVPHTKKCTKIGNFDYTEVAYVFNI